MVSKRSSGFTLIEVMVTVAIVAILAAIALPSYSAYVQRSRVPPGLDALSAYATRMEQAYQDSGRYGPGAACAPTLPTAANFTISCTGAPDGQSYTVRATGSGSMAGYTYSLNNTGTRRTEAHPKGVPGSNCWSIRGATCDDR